MTEPLDLAKGKRLLSEATPGPWCYCPPLLDDDEVGCLIDDDIGHLTAMFSREEDRWFVTWLRNNADTLIARAEEAEKLQPLVDAARTMVREYDEEITAHVARHGNVAGSQYGTTRRIEPLRKALAALNSPDRFSEQPQLADAPKEPI